MKLLVSAIACNPYLGSENYFGWSAVQCLARDHDLWVLTGRRNEADLARAKAEGIVPENIHFVFVGTFKPWHPNRMIARLQSWTEYLEFSRTLLPVARELHRKVRFDVAHHITYATWRVASPLWKCGVPFVLGPIGGCERLPLRFFSILSPAAKAFELARMVSNGKSRFSPAVRRSIRNAAHVFAANPETERLARAVRRDDAGVSRLSAAFYSERRIREFGEFCSLRDIHGPLRLFAGGNLEGRKGVALALRALAKVKAQGVPFRYHLGGSGPESGNLKQLAAALGLEREVAFGEGFSGEAYRRELGASHVFLLPSFRESAGLTMMEAMLAGCVPVVADCGGPAHIVTPECGYRLPVSDPEELVEAIAESLLMLNGNRERMVNMGQLARNRIATEFSDAHYRSNVNDIYRQVIRSSGTD